MGLLPIVFVCHMVVCWSIQHDLIPYYSKSPRRDEAPDDTNDGDLSPREVEYHHICYVLYSSLRS